MIFSTLSCSNQHCCLTNPSPFCSSHHAHSNHANTRRMTRVAGPRFAHIPQKPTYAHLLNSTFLTASSFFLSISSKRCHSFSLFISGSLFTKGAFTTSTFRVVLSNCAVLPLSLVHLYTRITLTWIPTKY